MHNERLLKNFLKLVFRKSKDTPEYTFWLDKDDETIGFDSVIDFSEHLKERNYDDITISLACGNEGMESIYGIAWTGRPPLRFHVPTLHLKKKGEESVSVWLFNKPVDRKTLTDIEKLFNKDIYALCDVPVTGLEADGWKIPKAEKRPRYNSPSDIIQSLDMEAEICLAFGPRAAAGKGEWNNIDTSIDAFIKGLFDHEAGKKDGLSFLQGEVAGSTRTAKAVIKNYIIGFDLDTGESADEIDERLKTLGYAYVRYTTHSHMATTSEIKRDAFFKWLGDEASLDASEDQVRRYLKDEKGYRTDVLKDLEITEQAQTSDEGVRILVEHNPVEKHRIIFFLNEPFVFQGKANQQEAIKAWREYYHGFGSELGFVYDQKTTDPSRLFYAPRHPKKSDTHETHFVDGAYVRLQDYPRLQMAKNSRNTVKLEGDKKRHKVGQINLVSWAKKNAEFFEVQQALEEHAPEDIFRAPRTNGAGTHIECPFEEDHTKAGGLGTFVINATENDEWSAGYTVMCSHDGCAGRDRLDFLKGMIANEWLPEDILKDEDFYEGREEAVVYEEIDEDDAADDEKDENVRPHYNNKKLIKKLNVFNKKYALTDVGSKVCIMKVPQTNKAFPEYIGTDGWLKKTANEQFALPDGKDGVSYKKMSTLWLEWQKRKSYDKVVFEPGKPYTRGEYNMFDGFYVKPDSVASWGLLKNHLLEVLCNGDLDHYDWFMTWMAQIIQQPATKMGACIVLRGEKGTGKTTMFEYLCEVLGKYATTVSDTKHVTGNFNAHQQGCLFMACEEAVWAGDAAANGVLKHMITDSTMMLERKGIDVIEVSNHCRIGMISNESWVVPAGLPQEERRYFILDVSNKRKKQVKYFEALRDQMDNGGVGALMHELMTWNPPQKDGWACLRNPPITEGLRHQAMESVNDLDRFLLDMIRENGVYEQDENYLFGIDLHEHLPTRVPKNLLRRHFTSQLSRSVQSTARSKANSSNAFNEVMEKYFFLAEKDCRKLSFKGTPYEGDCPDVGADKCARGYEIPPVSELRERIKKEYGINIPASEESS